MQAMCVVGRDSVQLGCGGVVFQQLAGSFANYATRRNRVSFAKRSEQFFSLFRSGRKRRVRIPPNFLRVAEEVHSATFT
jgi:hypothetical protein